MYIAYTIYIYTYILKLLNSLMSISLQCGLIKNRHFGKLVAKKARHYFLF